VKRLLLNCDQVFDVLTRGPFPTGSPDDEGVEHHLRACHDCRRLAEALRPAVSLLHEAVAADEALDLPEYQGSLPHAPPWRRRIAPAKAGKASRARPANRYAQSVNVLRLIAASVLVAALSLLVYGLTMSSRNDGTLLRVRDGLTLLPRAAAQLPDGTPDERGLIRLASLQLPATCFPEKHRLFADGDSGQLASALASGSLEALRCCTECHRAGMAQRKHGQVAAIAMESCQACHRG
jgi:hypothetical protein